MTTRPFPTPAATSGEEGFGALKVLDLFSGIGAYTLGLERTGGFKTVAFCEIEDYPVRILNKHWPKVPVYRDVRTLTADTLRRDGIAIDVICGGWPCQDISTAGTGLGLDGARSGLWSEVARLAGEIRPRFLILENSSNLLGLDGGRWFSRILGDLAALGYDAEWHCLPAAAFDAPHIRDRLWIVAHWREDASDAQGVGRNARRARDASQESRGRQSHRSGERAAVADTDRARRSRTRSAQSEERWRDPVAAGRGSVDADTYSLAALGSAIARRQCHSWEPEPGVVRVANGVADQVDRIHALGNCNPPIVIETIARALLSSLSSTRKD